MKNIEINLQAYHITWVTHGSRVSERMIEYGVALIEPVILDEQSRLLIADALAAKICEQGYSVIAVNILTDHVHCIIVCSEKDVSEIVHDLKGFSSHEHNRQLQLSVSGEGRQNKLWAKGSSQILITTEEYLSNAINYVENNHEKHGVSPVASSLYHNQLKLAMIGHEEAFQSDE